MRSIEDATRVIWLFGHFRYSNLTHLSRVYCPNPALTCIEIVPARLLELSAHEVSKIWRISEFSGSADNLAGSDEKYGELTGRCQFVAAANLQAFAERCKRTLDGSRALLVLGPCRGEGGFASGDADATLYNSLVYSHGFWRCAYRSIRPPALSLVRSTHSYLVASDGSPVPDFYRIT